VKQKPTLINDAIEHGKDKRGARRDGGIGGGKGRTSKLRQSWSDGLGGLTAISMQ